MHTNTESDVDNRKRHLKMWVRVPSGGQGENIYDEYDAGISLRHFS